MKALQKAGMVCAYLLLFGSVAFSQTSLAKPESISGYLLPFPNISDAPYSAVQESEITKTLRDGSRTISKMQVRLYRDSKGRTRREDFTSLPFGSTEAPTLVTIQICDPETKIEYFLQVKSHIATRFLNTPQRENSAGTSDGKAAVITDTHNPVETAKEKTLFETKTESLGTQVIGGFLAEGKRTTTTFPTGTFFPDTYGPVIRVQESWFSQDLKETVLFTKSDPLGQNISRLRNIDRSEPDTALFQVPSDYTIVDPDHSR